MEKGEKDPMTSQPEKNWLAIAGSTKSDSSIVASGACDFDRSALRVSSLSEVPLVPYPSGRYIVVSRAARRRPSWRAPRNGRFTEWPPASFWFSGLVRMPDERPDFYQRSWATSDGLCGLLAAG